MPPYKKAMPINIIPVEKAPIKKYLSAASLLFKLRLSLAVSMYKGIDKISMPKNKVSNVLKVAAMAMPHKTKNISAKYSDTLLPTFSISLPFNKKSSKVQTNATVIKIRLKLLNTSMFFMSIIKKECCFNNSMQLAIIASSRPPIAQYFGVLLCLKKTPPNIITIPQTAVIIIAFIIDGISHLAYPFYFKLVKSCYKCCYRIFCKV